MKKFIVRRARMKERKPNSKAAEKKLAAPVDIASDLEAESGPAPQDVVR